MLLVINIIVILIMTNIANVVVILILSLIVMVVVIFNTYTYSRLNSKLLQISLLLLLLVSQ